MTRSLILTVLGIGWLAFVTGCGEMGRARELANAAVDEFHGHFNEARFQEIFESGTEGFRDENTYEDFEEFLRAVHEKLGPVVSSRSTGWNVEVTSEKSTVTLEMETEFEDGTGQETFVYFVAGETAELYAYSINSRDLIID